jgi:hypothetical protein
LEDGIKTLPYGYKGADYAGMKRLDGNSSEKEVRQRGGKENSER